MFARALFIIALLLISSQHGNCETVVWQIAPAYSTAENRSFALELTDDQRTQRTMYTDSRAVLIMESNYAEGKNWLSLVDPANENEQVLVKVLESRGFHVDVWRNLRSAELKTVVADVFGNYGNLLDGRLFFYYYGHGYTLGSAADPNGSRTFIVPVDSPDPAEDAQSFRSKAFYISQLVEYAKEATTKHIFFALEACRAGAIISTLGAGGFPIAPKGYLLSPELQSPARQFLTAGSAEQDIPARGEFTSLIVEGLANADYNNDGYVTGTELMQFVSTSLPQRAPGQKPEVGKVGSQDGDVILGPINPQAPKDVQRTAVQAPQFALCRHPDHGLERWSNSMTWSADSGWRSGGSDPLSFCNSQKVQREKSFPDRNVTLVHTSEDHRATYNPFKHDEYRYGCQFLDQWGPIYKEARSASCGHL